jgi:decaprenylphospho-beta-D-erythro-pentofuranosid-2-ulose 2-reductase
MTEDRPLGPKVIILGALSAIAEAAAREWADARASLMLAARSRNQLEAVASDLRVRGAQVYTHIADLSSPWAAEALEELVTRLGGVDIVLLAYGVLGDQKLAEHDPVEAQRILNTNFTSAIAWCLAVANVLERQRRGTLIVIGSVAGDRGRGSNYIYGASKGGLGVLVQGLAHRLAPVGAQAILIKPGLVDTPMTAEIARNGLLWTKPQTIARAIVAAGRQAKRSATVVHCPWFWRWIILILWLMPTGLFHRTRL